MAMAPERSKPLHNFELPCLKWGNQKYLRCMKLDDASTATDSSSAAAGGHYQRPRHTFQRRRSPPSKFESLVVGGTTAIEDVEGRCGGGDRGSKGEANEGS
ncbi:hypothetical protein COLO4_32387 [Corchorus olitorius]|uniref:Uncharacterized protein n=1 Tax=Corchorus olitorius TaxID=93759 RepID=A0A1R3GZH6_9ROSI|nr:hypothetical protein COLO4_32387 [Corchorus olitorius]